MFCGMLNLPKPMINNNFDLISNTFSVAAKEVAEKSMLDAANELRHGDDSIVDISVSVDGTWQRRGSVSLNGTVAAISMYNGKIINVEVMQRYCKPYQQHKEKLTPDDFDVWYEGHKQNCVANYEGSAPMMEVVGAKRIFERSITSRKLRYIKYFGDGDSKAYFEVKDTYKPDMVNKYECVRHYQNRLGTRLRKLKKTTKGIDRCSYRQTWPYVQILVVQCRKWLMQFGLVFCMFPATKHTNVTLFATRLGVSTAETRLIILIYLNMDQVFQMK